jgi:hypothetical protein
MMIRPYELFCQQRGGFSSAGRGHGRANAKSSESRVPHVIASAAKQSTTRRIEIASSLRFSQ